MGILNNKERLDKLGVGSDVLDRYRERHRFYHNLAHLDDICEQFDRQGLGDNDTLLLATVFHDVIYDPQSATNEEDSAAYFDAVFKGEQLIKDEVIQIILDTKTHQPKTELSKIFSGADLNILRQPFDKLLVYEQQIFKEFQFVDYNIYKQKRVEVLQHLSAMVDNPALNYLIDYLSTRKPNIAVYPGSFNPFHKGHLNILEKAGRIFDKVIIAQGVNPGKDASTYQLPTLIKHHQIARYEGLLTDFINQLGYDVTVIRGLRNGTDLQYELNQYRYLQELSDKKLQIISIFCDSEFEHISSTGIRQLEKYGKAAAYLLD